MTTNTSTRGGRGSGPCRHDARLAGALAAALVLAAASAEAQTLRFGNHREVNPPDYATIRLGPFYSTIRFTQSVGYRYSTSRGAGTDYLTATRRGVIREDGSEFPMVSALDFRNYLLVTPTVDLDMSVQAGYAHYPLRTQEDDSYISMADEGVYGAFSTELDLTPYLRARLFDDIKYKTDYVDTRGLVDEAGGERFEYLNNTVGVDTDWLFAKDRNLELSLSRFDQWSMSSAFDDQEQVAYKERVGYGQELAPDTTWGLAAEFTQTDYADEDRGDSVLQSYSTTLALGPESVLPLNRSSTLKLGLGYAIGSVEDVVSTNGAVVEGGQTEEVTAQASLATELSQHWSQLISAGRTVQQGFRSAFETVDAYHYGLTWKGDVTTELFTDLADVHASRTDVTGYRDWSSGIRTSYPLNRYLSLLLSSVYTVRDNEAEGTVAEGDAENQSDYETWISTVGTGLGLTESISFNTSFQHTERTSRDSALEFIRDTFLATLTYTHTF